MCLEITHQHLVVGTQLMHKHHVGELCHGCLELRGETGPVPPVSWQQLCTAVPRLLEEIQDFFPAIGNLML